MDYFNTLLSKQNLTSKPQKQVSFTQISNTKKHVDKIPSLSQRTNARTRDSLWIGHQITKIPKFQIFDKGEIKKFSCYQHSKLFEELENEENK